MKKAQVGLLGRQLGNEKTEKAERMQGRQAWGGRGKAVPSPEDVEADVALEVNVGMINHCLTLHLGGIMRITLSHLAPEKEKGDGWVF